MSESPFHDVKPGRLPAAAYAQRLQAAETPALTRRTFDWLSMRLLKGISREDARVIFCMLVTRPISVTGAGSLSPDCQPVTKTPSRL